ncbi:hypothetical protein KCU81_g280, partial [Aureobasidium melanogenum]
MGPQRSPSAYRAVKLSPLPPATLDNVLDTDLCTRMRLDLGATTVRTITVIISIVAWTCCDGYGLIEERGFFQELRATQDESCAMAGASATAGSGAVIPDTRSLVQAIEIAHRCDDRVRSVMGRDHDAHGKTSTVLTVLTFWNVESSADGSMVCPRWRRQGSCWHWESKQPPWLLFSLGSRNVGDPLYTSGGQDVCSLSDTAIKIALLREADPSSLVPPAQHASPEYMAGSTLSVYRFVNSAALWAACGSQLEALRLPTSSSACAI